MSLKLKKVESFKARVNVQVLTGDADRTQDASFVAEFKHLNREQFDALMAKSPTDAEFLDEVLIGVAEVSNEDGSAMAFAEARDAIKSDLGYSGATVRTFIETLGGAAAKNSNRSRAR